MSRIEISKKLVLINSASSLATRMLSLSVLVWLQQYLLKRISPEEYSLLPLLYSVMAFAPLITTVLTGGLGRFITVAYARDDDEEVTRIVSTMFPILCVAGVLFLAGGWTFAWYVDRVLTIAPERVWDARIMMAILMFSAAIRLPLAPFGAGFFVRQKFVLENLIQVGTEIFRLTLLFTLLFGVSTRVLWVITASTVAELVNLTITRSISMRLVPELRFRINAIHWPIAKEITSFGGWSLVGQVADTMSTSLDVILLNRFGTAVDVTTFHVGTLPQRKLSSFTSVIQSSLGPVLTSMYATRDERRLKSTYLRVGRYALWASLLVACPCMVFSREIIDLYIGAEYAAAGTVMLVSFALYPIGYGSLLRPAIAHAMGRVRENNLIVLLMAAVNVSATVYFVCFLRWGAVGSALGTFIGQFTMVPLLVWPFGLRLVKATWREFLGETLGPGLAPAAVCGALLVALKLAIDPSTWLMLAVCAALGMLVYGAVTVLFCLFPVDRDLLLQLWGRVAVRVSSALPSRVHP